MLPSINSNYNGNNPIISNSTDQTLLYHKPFINDDDTPSLFSSLYHFPYSPFTHYQSENDELFLQTYQDLPFITTTAAAAADHNTNNPTAADTNMINNMLYNMVDSNKTSPTPTPPRKRTSKKDRHSKINTAKGLRDRRMRLSFEIARDFFGLQDMLGFDKASRTVGWLLSKAESDIKKLVAVKSGGSLIHTVDSSSVVGAKSVSSASECEVISGIEHGKPSKCVNKEKNMRRDVRKGAVSLARSRESREKARAWARERTKAKSKLIIADDATTIQDSNQVGSSLSPMSLEVVQALAEVEKPNSHDGRCVGGVADMVDHDDDHSFQVIMDKWSSTSIFNYHCTTGISQEQQQHQFEDFQCYNKSWESYNIQSLL